MKRFALPVLAAVAALLLNGCGIIMFGAVVTGTAVAGTGYVVYKTGETVVVGTGKAAGGVYHAGQKLVSGTGEAAGKTADTVQEIIFVNNEMKATCAADVRATHAAATSALIGLGFSGVHGLADAASGTLEAMTVDNHKIEIGLKYSDPQRTAIRIRVGARGDMNTSELIYNSILQKL